jgi:hypothetical protein
VRLRQLAGGSLLPGTPAELALRLDDMASCPVAADQILIVENEVTYLVLPPVPGMVAVLSGRLRWPS